MKKTLFSLLSAAALLWSTSCSDETIAPEVGGEGLVQFTVELNDGSSASRAISDAGNISELYYEVWAYQNGQTTPVKTDIDAVEKKFSVVDGKKQFNVNFHLVKGQKYDVVFWAQSEDAYNADDLTQIAVTPADANDDTRDAFTAVYPIEKVDGSKSHKVTLRRPFAQVNFGVTGEDYDAATAAGLNLSAETSSITVSSVATKYNALTTKADAHARDFTFSAKVLPTLEGADAEKLTIGNVDYKYLATAYVLVNGEKAENQADVVNLTMNLTTNLNEAITLSVPNAPIRRNYRTNVIGNLLTNQTDFTVVVDATFAGEENLNTPYFAIGETRYTTFAEALAAAQDGETITLVGDAKFETEANVHLFVVEGKNITIDLNGNTIVANIPDVTKNTAIFQVKKGAGLTIEGEGNIHLQTNKAVNALAAFISNEGGVVNLKGGNWTLKALEYPDALIPTFVDNNSNVNSATLNIYGGTYTFHRNLFRNFANAAGHNNFATVATINIYGGTFNGKVDDAGTIWNQKPSASTPAGAGVINVVGGTFNNVTIDDEFAGVVYAYNQDEFVNALANTNTHTIMLGVGEFTADIYNSTLAKESLTIIGSEGTKVKFANQQVRMALFKNFKIENCEIMHMANKSWGMLVFGGGDKADGVYTISNCTFNGVGTQGIYINESTSGATYNIENCTFNGDFGNEGAITIQTNIDVNYTVNVNGCEFNNIPETSHRIYLAKSSNGFYYGWNLNTDLKAYSAYDIATFVALGFETINLADGEYDIYGCAGKTLILNGSKDAVLILKNEGEDGCDYAFGGSGAGVGNITFNGLTINTTQNTGNYKGFAYMKGTFNNCNFVGAYALNNNNDFVFNNCTFDFKNGYFWTWGANSVTFDGCTFNGNSKAILAHGYASTTINIKDCTFAAIEKGYTGSGDNTACVEIDPAGNNTYNINFSGNNTKTEYYAGWTRVKDGTTGHKINM